MLSPLLRCTTFPNKCLVHIQLLSFDVHVLILFEFQRWMISVHQFRIPFLNNA